MITSATVDSGMTMPIGMDGDKAVVNNDACHTARVDDNGVDGKDSTGTEINGDKAIVNNDGDSTILDGGTGTRITGDDGR
ncbi:hypothetical protein ACNGRI_11095 [Escherichia coli]